ncbi:MAG: phosphoribosylamine--glycine ligase [Candidatus Omnitrophota bacterium]
MDILVIGSGGREHAICWKLNMSPSAGKIYCAPGNGGTASCAENTELDVKDHKAVINFCRARKIDLVVIGPEAPLAAGITDDLEKAGINVFGPSYAASRMESSKIFSKEIMGQYNVPTAAFKIFDDFNRAKKYLSNAAYPVVVKAYGLAAGKGVVIAERAEEAIEAAENMLVRKQFSSAGDKIIVEDFLRGEEASVLVVTDGEEVIPLASSQDHKRINDGDTGPNTGGMGAYSPAPVIDSRLMREIMENIVRPTIKGLKSEGILYKGILYSGIMITDKGPEVLEYNVRFGDPETQAILPRLKSDLAEVMMAVAKGELSGMEMEWDEREFVCVVLSSGGYPGDYENGKKITGIEEAEKEGALVFHAGTTFKNGEFFTSGGRVLNIVGAGRDIKEAVENTYRAVEKINFEGMHYRKDIACRAIARI